jgi:hypothetical protein
MAAAPYNPLSLRERAGVRGSENAKLFQSPHPVLLPEGEGTYETRLSCLATAAIPAKLIDTRDPIGPKGC